MKREIKFRVYDTLVGEMVDTGMHVIGESFCCGRIESWIRNHKHQKAFIERYNDMVLMQYTGYQDENDNYIYHSDIVEGNYAAPWNHRERIFLKALVKWEYGGWCLENLDEVSYSGYLAKLDPEHHWVLGNKFENPELVSGQE